MTRTIGFRDPDSDQNEIAEVRQALADLGAEEGHFFSWPVVAHLFSLAEFLSASDLRNDDGSVQSHGEALVEIASHNPSLSSLICWGFLISALTLNGDWNRILLARTRSCEAALEPDRQEPVGLLIKTRIDELVVKEAMRKQFFPPTPHFAAHAPDLFSQEAIFKLLGGANDAINPYSHHGRIDMQGDNEQTIAERNTLIALAKRRDDVKQLLDEKAGSWWKRDPEKASVGVEPKDRIVSLSHGLPETRIIPPDVACVVIGSSYIPLPQGEKTLTLTAALLETRPAPGAPQSITLKRNQEGQYVAIKIEGPFLIRPRPCDAERFLFTGEVLSEGAVLSIFSFPSSIRIGRSSEHNAQAQLRAL